MDKDIVEYCIKTISFINNNKDDYEKIIALLFKELRDNDIVYINRKELWYKYNKNDKIWERYNFRILLSKITELYEFFDDIMIKYLDNENSRLNNNNKSRFKSVSRLIASYIFEQKIDMTKLYKICSNIFSIDNDI
jgi:glucosamine 6-phosphate synthetase-like amidotransferase/phosphosugar isomerase protein